MTDKEDFDKVIEELVDAGLLISQLDDSGETVYLLAPDCAEKAPGLWQLFVEDLQKAVYRLWRQDMLDISFSEEGPLMDTIILTGLIDDTEAVNKLNTMDQIYLKEIVRALSY